MKIIPKIVFLLVLCVAVRGDVPALPDLAVAEKQYVDVLTSSTRAYRIELAKALRTVQSVRVAEIENEPVRFEDFKKNDPLRSYFEVRGWQMAFPIVHSSITTGEPCAKLMASLSAALLPNSDDIVLGPFGFVPLYGVEVVLNGRETIFLVGAGQLAWFPPTTPGLRGDVWAIESIPFSSDFERQVDSIRKETSKPNHSPAPTPGTVH